MNVREMGPNRAILPDYCESELRIQARVPTIKIALTFRIAKVRLSSHTRNKPTQNGSNLGFPEFNRP